jgi:hypothetical protein
MKVRRGDEYIEVLDSSIKGEWYVKSPYVTPELHRYNQEYFQVDLVEEF